ncbi:MAG: hypothetical protein PHW53_05020 [Patescibacteria group bacterium]|nr:hypothetical protein [Patescibacteria group bacterium]
MIISNFRGIFNVSPPRSIPNNALTAATDIDIDDAGILTRRNGFAIAKAISSVTSAYSTLDQSGYVVASGTLSRVLPDLSLIALGASTATSFTDFAGVLFTNDGLKVEDNTVTNIKLPSPSSPPVLSAILGTMPAGTYSAAYCYRSATGLESGSSPIASIELTVNGGITIAPITPPAGYTVTTYMTDAGGTTFYSSNGVQLSPTQILADSFPDDINKLVYFENRLYVSRNLSNGSTIVWRSAPYLYHLYDMQKDYVVIPGEIRDMATTNGAIIICTDSCIYAYDGDVLTTLAMYGVPAGRSIARLPDGGVLIHTLRGTCSALPFINITEKKFSAAPGIQCSTAIVEQDGIKKMVILTDGSGVAWNKRS